jgi:hypothetical protein
MRFGNEIVRNILKKSGFSSNNDHDLRTEEKRLIDLTGSLERMQKAMSSGT